MPPRSRILLFLPRPVTRVQTLRSTFPYSTAQPTPSSRPYLRPPRCCCRPEPPPNTPRTSVFYSGTTRRTLTTTMASATSFYDFKPLDKKGTEVPLSDFKGKVVLVVNTASKCGFTPQFEGLEKLYQKVKADHGDDFAVLGFPCNQFGGQDPGTDDEIQSFCQINYGVTFPMLKKIDVNGANADPLFEWLKKEKPGIMGIKSVKWNFEKFLIGKDGTVKGRWASTTKPEALESAILEELSK